MERVRRAVARLLRDEAGQDLIEYAMLLAFLAFAGIVIMKGFAANISSFFQGLDQTLTNA
jgi:Flp pilus assembly pilin Flp